MIKKWLSVSCMICLLVNLLVAHADTNLQLGTISTTNRVPVLTLSLGSENGQVRYGGVEASGYTGPNSFVVENGVIYVLDAVNYRINIYQNGSCSEIALENCYQPQGLTYENGKLAVFDNSDGVTLVYTTSGALVARIMHKDEVKEELALKIAEIGDTYVVWETFAGNQYRYDWGTNVLAAAEAKLLRSSSDDTVTLTTAGKQVGKWSIDSENKVQNILGVKDGALVYQQYEYVPDVDMLFTELSVRKVQADGTETYAIIDFSDWKAPATDPFYLSSDGKLYVMECIENGTVISEVVLRTTDKSQIETLKQKAEARRLEVKAQEESRSVNAETRFEHTDYRSVVENRAKQMMDYKWEVLPSHKVERPGMEAYIEIPYYVAGAANNSYVTGIPYCWGGYYGVFGSGYAYPTFASMVGLTNKTAGNINSDYYTLVPDTIGLDCVGFLMCAYRMSGEKQLSGFYTGVGTSVALTNLKPMDIIAKSGHVMIYAGMSGSNCVTYEAYVSGDGTGKACRNTTRTVASLSAGGYVGRTLFCETCNASIKTAISSTHHADYCTQCGYIWPNTEEEHSLVDMVWYSECTICGYYSEEFQE